MSSRVKDIISNTKITLTQRDDVEINPWLEINKKYLTNEQFEEINKSYFMSESEIEYRQELKDKSLQPSWYYEHKGDNIVEFGKKIKTGDTVMIVEAMKTMNHVPSTKDGVVKKVVVEDGQPVEYGQTLVILE